MVRHRRWPSFAHLVSLRWPRSVAIGFCGVLGVLLPAAFGAIHGVPPPLIHDEFSYLLGADTLANGRLTNPSPPLPEFFESPHVLVVPSYNSMYPVGQSLVLAVGQLIGQPIWGVWLSCGLFAASLCWMLQAWSSRKWALTVTVLSIVTLGTSTYWAQSYWGGMVAASGAALLLGGLRRILRAPRPLTSVPLALGALILANTRPFEGLLLCVASAVMLSRQMVRSCRRRRSGLTLGLSLVPGAGLLIVGGIAMLIVQPGGYWQRLADAIRSASRAVFSPGRVPVQPGPRTGTDATRTPRGFLPQLLVPTRARRAAVDPRRGACVLLPCWRPRSRFRFGPATLGRKRAVSWGAPLAGGPGKRVGEAVGAACAVSGNHRRARGGACLVARAVLPGPTLGPRHCSLDHGG